MTRQVSLPIGVQRLAGQAKIPFAASASQGQEGLKLKDVVGLLRRRMWLIIIITTFFTISSIVLFYLFKRYSPEYTSVGFMRCKMPTEASIFGSGTVLPRKEIIAMAAASNAAVMQSEAFLGELLQRTEVMNTQWWQDRKFDEVKRLEDMRDGFSASALRDTEYLKISMSMTNPQEAKVIIDAALRQHVSNQKDLATASLYEGLNSLTSQRNEVETQIKRLEGQLLEMSTESQVAGWQEDGQTIVGREAELLREEQLALEASIRSLQIYRMQLVGQQQSAQGISINVQAAIRQDRMVMGYKDQLARAIQTRGMLIKRLGPDHRQIKDIESVIQIIETQLNEMEMQLREQYSSQEMKSIETQVISQMEELKSIGGQYDEVNAKLLDLSQKKITYRRTEEEIKLLKARMEEFERTISGDKVKLKDPGLVTVEIAMVGDVPLRISFPKLAVFLPSGIVLGLLVSVGLAFLLEFMDDSVKQPSDVMRYLNVPLLGMIPVYEEEEEEEEEEGEEKEEVCVEKITMSHPHALMSEFYRQVRTNLFFCAPVSELKTLLITSSSAGCGKTTTAVNLSITLAAEGKRVLLVDANFRRPALKRLFPAETPAKGLSNVLVGQVAIKDIIRPSGLEGLDLIDSGPLPPNPADLLGGQRMRDFLESHADSYDHIIIDGPPSLVVIDSRILAGLVDGTIAVVHAKQSSRGMSQRMIMELKRGGERVRLLGVILNAVHARKGGYFEKAYRSYYDYVGVEPVAVLSQPEKMNKDEKSES